MTLVGLLGGGTALAAPPDEAPSPATERSLTVLLRGTYLRLEDKETDESQRLGGAGFAVQGRLSRRWGIELATDAVQGNERTTDANPAGTVHAALVPATASAMFFLRPDADLSFYLLAGGGAALQTIEFEELGLRQKSVLPLAQLGVGLTLRMGNWRLDSDVRGVALWRASDRLEATGEGGIAEPSYAPRRGERELGGGMWTLGVGYVF